MSHKTLPSQSCYTRSKCSLKKKKKKNPLPCVPRLPHFLAFSYFLSKHSPPGLLLFTRWCQKSFQSILSQEAKATKRVRLCLPKLHQAQKRTAADTGDVRPQSSPDTTDETSVITLNAYLCSTQRKIKRILLYI